MNNEQHIKFCEPVTDASCTSYEKITFRALRAYRCKGLLVLGDMACNSGHTDYPTSTFFAKMAEALTIAGGVHGHRRRQLRSVDHLQLRECVPDGRRMISCF